MTGIFYSQKHCLLGSESTSDHPTSVSGMQTSVIPVTTIFLNHGAPSISDPQKSYCTDPIFPFSRERGMAKNVDPAVQESKF